MFKLFESKSEELFVGCFFGNIGGSASGEVNSQIVKELVAVDWGIFDLSFSEVEHSLELPVIGVVLFVSDCHKVQISSSFI